MKSAKKLNFWRLVWTLFVTWYFINFSRNFFNSLTSDKAQIPVVFFIILVLWMTLEYYFASPFFQSGIVVMHGWLKLFFSLFFYVMAIYSITDYVSLNWTQVSFAYPYLNIAGLIVFALGVLIRLATLFHLLNQPQNKLVRSGLFNVCRHPRYLGTLLQIIAIPLIFSSYLGLIASLIFGLLLIYLEMQAEEQVLSKQYKDEYIEYQKHVPFLFPNLERLSRPKAKTSSGKRK
ncbi:MAG: isoprenylcysteine carboxylmethyltransferase family protein [Candidatus Latescibacteria bacterium]|nr:isoprenylcysteine carboxylmethyltransferase family protein [Candidatus Latescibacterota bacterium]